MCGKSSGIALLLFLLAIPPAGAQTPSGELSGTVTDPSGREIPGNRGSAWPEAWRREALWEDER